MRASLVALISSLFVMLAADANAMTVGTAPGIRQGFAETDVVQRAVRVCRRNIFTGRVRCWVDRTRPPTVCHVVRSRDGRRRLDCY